MARLREEAEEQGHPQVGHGQVPVQETRGKVPYCTSYATFPLSALTLQQSDERLPESRFFAEEKCRTVPVMPRFL